MTSSGEKKQIRKETNEDEFEIYLKNQCMKTTFNGIEIESLGWYKSLLGINK